MQSPKQPKRYSTDSSDVISDASTRWGIIVLAILLVLLIIFFFWYNNRALDTASLGKEEPAAGNIFSRIFSAEEPSETAPVSDSDKDGLADEAEAQAGTDPQKADTDADGLTDREETQVYKTQAKNKDTDGDGLSDGEEIKLRRDPLDKNPAAVWPPLPAAGTK